MALKNYIYQSNGSVTLGNLVPLLAPAAAPSIFPVTGTPLVTIRVDEVHKDDLDEAMAQFGYTYLAEQPGTVPGGRRDFGVLAVDPTIPAPQIGDNYFNSTLRVSKWYNGSVWITSIVSSDVLVDFNFSDLSPVFLSLLTAGAVAEETKLVLTTTFDDPNATLQVGTSASPGAILDATQNDPGDIAVYSTDVPLRIVGPTNLILTISPGVSTQGAGYVLVRVRQ